MSHISGASDTGYRVIEVFESREAHQAWYDSHIAQNLPPGTELKMEYIDVTLSLPAD